MTRFVIAVSVVLALALPAVAQQPHPQPRDGQGGTSSSAASMAAARDMIINGRRKKDAELMFEGARALLRVQGTKDAKRARTPGGVDPLTILDEAERLAVNNAELLSEINALRRAQPALGQCNWKWQCSSAGCAWVQACN